MCQVKLSSQELNKAVLLTQYLMNRFMERLGRLLGRLHCHIDFQYTISFFYRKLYISIIFYLQFNSLSGSIQQRSDFINKLLRSTLTIPCIIENKSSYLKFVSTKIILASPPWYILPSQCPPKFIINCISTISLKKMYI